MGRPPCCDKVGIKKGPWTPEEDIILVSYIQQHGPGNWRSVPTNTGLLRCSKSCRLRWTNYLRPGIKRGNFTSHEEGMIIHLQALLGNKWAAIASYLPQRTDNDIKNYWNTHLKKKLKKFHSALDSSTTSITSLNISDQKRSCLDFAAATSSSTSSAAASTYASSTENISRLLEGWMRPSPKKEAATATADQQLQQEFDSLGSINYSLHQPKTEAGSDLISHKELESILSFDHHQNINNVVAWDHNKSTSDNSTTSKGTINSQHSTGDDDNKDNIDVDVGTIVTIPERKQKTDQNSNNNNVTNNNNNNNDSGPPLSFLEKWLLDESSAGQVEEMNQMMELSSIF